MDRRELAAAGAFAPGELIADRFEIETLAGKGGMAEVYRAHDRQNGETVAVKLLHGGSGENAERLVREAGVLARLGHPGIVRYVDHGTTGVGETYLVMEWLEGEDLSQRLSRGRLSVEETLVVARRASDALAAAHAQSLVHRDLKPSNLFLPGGRVEDLKVLDFGIVRLSQASIAATATGTILGTPAYMAPEQARGERHVDARADVFSMGCVLAECLTGRQVFAGAHALAVLARILLEEATRVSESCPDVPSALDDLIARMLSKEPGLRPADARALLAELETLDLTAAAVEAAPAAPVGITAGEQRVLAVVLVATSPATRREVPQAYYLAVNRHGGKLEPLANGSLLAVLSESAAATDLVREAARCALELRALAPGVPVALATGRGSLDQKLPVGEVVDRAVDLLRRGRADDAGPRLDEVSAGLVDARFQVQGDDRGLVLAGERDLAEEARTLLGKATTFVGRDREIEALMSYWEECVEEPMAHAVIVTAAAGMGKSRLRSELLRRVRERDRPMEVWMARGDAIGAGAPFGMVGQLVRRAAQVVDAESLALRHQKLHSRLGRHLDGADLARATEFLAELIGAPFAAADASVELQAARQDPRVMGDQMQRAFEDFLAVECGAQPVLIVLEDLHWGDTPSVRFVDGALRHLRDRPLMVLALGRPELEDLFPRLWADRSAQSIRLGDLTSRASAKLVREILGPDLPDGTVDRLVAQAAGNAFYLEELVRAVSEGRDSALPETVVAMAQARLEQLDPGERRLLRAASVFGGAFWRSGIETLLGGQPGGAALDQLIDTIVERELAQRDAESRFPGERQFRFRHGLVREAAYAALTAEDLRLGHRLAGDWLERAGEGDAGVLAEHFDRGGEPARAVPWYVEATRHALQGLDLVAVLSRVVRGVACGAAGEARAELRIMEAHAHLRRSEHHDEQACALEALELFETGSARWCFAAGMVAQASMHVGDRERLEATAGALQAEAAKAVDPSPEMVTAMARGVLALYSLGLNDAAEGFLGWLDEKRDAAAMSHSAAMLVVLMARARRALQRGDTGEHLVLRERVAEIAEKLGHRPTTCITRENVGYTYLQLGMYTEAEGALRDSIASAQWLGLRTTITTATNNLGLARALQGALAEGLALEEEALVQASATGHVRLVGGVRIYLARILAMSGDLERAEREARAAAEVLATAPPLEAYALGVLSDVLRRSGRTDEALDISRRAMAIVENLGGIEEGETLARLAHVEALAAAGEGTAASEILAETRDRLVAQAGRIADPKFRGSFLENVYENARVMALAREWLGAIEKV